MLAQGRVRLSTSSGLLARSAGARLARCMSTKAEPDEVKMVAPHFDCKKCLTVVARPETGLRVTRSGLASAAGARVGNIESTLSHADCTLTPVFGNEDRINANVASLRKDLDEFEDGGEGADVPELAGYYRCEGPEDRLEEVAEKLLKDDGIKAAYVAPDAEPPVFEVPADNVAQLPEAATMTPDYLDLQGYLRAAPDGVDADYARTLRGGRGEGMWGIDVEGGWTLSHEDLPNSQGGLVIGTNSQDINWRNHGTAVLGEIGGDQNGYGVRGIAPAAFMRVASIFGTTTAGAMRAAADRLRPGDVLLIELHRRKGLEDGDFMPMEWYPDTFDAIKYATMKGIIVVEAAGNGGQNFDDPVHDTPLPGFPDDWTNPVTRKNRDSGAILVGAGAPPSFPNPRARLGFSNYGAAVDTQGWGQRVTTAGYGALQGGADENLWYTATFNGTSSASPIVTGALLSVQGILRTNNRRLLTPRRARRLLRSTGTPQPRNNRHERIGNLPDIREMVDRLF